MNCLALYSFNEAHVLPSVRTVAWQCSARMSPHGANVSYDVTHGRCLPVFPRYRGGVQMGCWQ